jgi:transglutaminase-like putative cysteine protease
MSTTTGTGRAGSASGGVAGRLRGLLETPSGPRVAALAALAVLTLTYVSVLYEAVTIAADGDPLVFGAVAAAALLAAVVLGRFLPAWVAAVVTLLLAVAGGIVYLPIVLAAETTPAVLDRFVADTVALLTGLSILRIISVGTWATAVVPVPLFLSWYLATRRRYGLAVAAGGGALVFFVLTGNATAETTLIGVLAGAAAVGLGDLDVRGGSLLGADAVAVVLAVMVLLTVTVSFVPGTAGQPLLPAGAAAGAGGDTLETSLTGADGDLSIQGSISLSPEVRWTVSSEAPDYWRVAAYNRFTGDGWVRTAARSNGSLGAPPGDSRPLRQTYTAESNIETMPAAWRPTGVEGYSARVTGFGGLQPTEPLSAGDRYTVTSRVPSATPTELREAGRDYPDSVQPYLETGGLSQGFVSDVTVLTSNADNPYDTARTIENALEESKNYSLDVTRPSGNIAESFFYEMDAGYCTYFATTMVMMLRSQGIPARFVVGYTTGQQVGPNEYVVRGYNSHAWVEAYFPGHGWIRFDPTPAAPRQSAEQATLETAREEQADDVDVPESEPTQTPEVTTTTPSELPGNDTIDGGNVSTTPDLGPISGPGGGPTAETDDGFSLPTPSREQVVLALVVLVGAAVGVRRSDAATRAYREVWLRRQPRSGPERDVRRAFDRLEYLLERDGRARADGETPRQYVRAVGDERARRVGELYERAVYGGEATEEMAEEAIALVDELVSERGWF